jgi:multidrug resistance protein, MATE family
MSPEHDAPTGDEAECSVADDADSAIPEPRDVRPGDEHRPGSTRELIRIALPLVLSAGSLSLMNFCDRLFLLGYSEAALAASLPAHMLHWVLLSLPLGTAFYATTFVAQYDGAGRRDRVGRAMWQAILLSIGAGILMIGLVPLAGPIFSLTNHAADVREQEAAILATMCWGSLPILLAPTLACFYIGRGRSNVVLWANVSSVVLNLVLDPPLIYGWGPIPELGAVGAAIATVLGRVLACGVYVWLMATGDEARPYQLWRQRGFDGPLFRRMLRYGLPNGFYWFVDVTAFSVMIFLIGNLGPRELVATNLAFNLNMLAFIPMIGIGHSISALVGRRIGEGRPDLAVESSWAGFRLAGGYMLPWAIAFVLVPRAVIAPYVWINDIEGFDAVADLTIVLLRYVAVYSIFDAMAVVFSNSIRGAGDTKFALWFTLLTSWFLWAIPVIVLYYAFGAGLHAMWTACTLYIVVVGIGFLLRFLEGKWKSMTVIEEEAREAPLDGIRLPHDVGPRDVPVESYVDAAGSKSVAP